MNLTDTQPTAANEERAAAWWHIKWAPRTDVVHGIALLLDSAEKRGREEGRREEAERIVRWLRAAVEEGNVAVCMAETRAEYERAVGFAAGFQIAADAIEAGKHHEPVAPEGDSDE